MSEYLKGIVGAKAALTDTEQKVLFNTGNLPVLNRANTTLPPLQEVIVKSIYLAGGLFLSDIKKLVCFHSDIQKTERAVKALIKGGYLISQNTSMGVLYGLTKEGISQIRYHKDYCSLEQGTVSAMKLDIENSLMKRKLTSALIAEYVFSIQVKELFDLYFRTDKLTRNLYLMKQYLKNISYRESLTKAYSQKDAELFADTLLAEQGFEKLKSTEEYHRYIAYVRKNCLTTPTEGTFYLLKEMQTEKTSEYRILEILQHWNCNVLRFGMTRIWNSLGEELQHNSLLHREQALETCNQYIKYLGDERRSLIQTNAYKKQEDSELLKQITEKLAQLDACLTKLRTQKEQLETDFCFPVLSSYDEDGNSYEERVLTFKRLEQNAVYMEHTEKRKLTFYIIQIQDDYFDLFSLHKKVAMLCQICRRIFPLYHLEIQVLTDAEEQCQFIESKLASLQKKLLASRETAFLGNTLPEVMTVRVVHSRIAERFHFYHQLYEFLKGEPTDESE